MKYSEDKNVAFNDKSHVYFKKDKQLLSVTTFINQFKNKFDSDYYSKKIALRENKTQDDVLFEWKEKAFRSTEIGTAIHKIFEDYTFNNYSILNDDYVFEIPNIKEEYFLEYNNKKKTALLFIKNFFLTQRLKPIYSEYIVYNDFLAGQIDSICVDKENNYYILDFKTNKEIGYNSYGKKMLNTFNFIDDCTYYHYCLQLSIYKSMAKIHIKKIYLVHITEDKYNFIECEDVIKNNNIHLFKLF
jgi:hypothetical protein